jgi:hypothetical protein
MAGFSLDVSAFCEKAKKNPETVMRAVSIKLFSAIIKGSPVDTGRFRMNWQASGSSPASGTIPGTDVSGDKASSDAANFVTATSDWQELTLTNNLPYAEVLEFGGYPGDGPNTIGGYSKQAPAGMVRVNITRFNTLLNEEAAKVK